MIYGYIKYGSVYDQRHNKELHGIGYFDSKNEFILEPNENTLHYTPFDTVHIKNDWKSRIVTYPYPFNGYCGDGTTVITNKRIFHYRMPNPDKTSVNSTSGQYLSDLAKSERNYKAAKELLAAGGLEFCEVRLDEIVQSYYYPDQKVGGGFDLVSERQRFHLTTSENSWKLFELVTEVKKAQEVHRVRSSKKEARIQYIDPLKLDSKLQAKRDSLLAKAYKYESKGKKDKALVQYNKILELMPSDEETRKKVEELSSPLYKYTVR